MQGQLNVYRSNDKYFVVASTIEINVDKEVRSVNRLISNSIDTFKLLVSLNTSESYTRDILNLCSTEGDVRCVDRFELQNGTHGYKLISILHKVPFENFRYRLTNNNLIVGKRCDDLIKKFIEVETFLRNDPSPIEVHRMFNDTVVFKTFSNTSIEEMDMNFVKSLRYNSMYTINEIKQMYLKNISDVSILKLKDSIFFSKSIASHPYGMEITLKYDNKDTNITMYCNKKYNFYTLMLGGIRRIIKSDVDYTSDIPATQYFIEFLKCSKINIDTFENITLMYRNYLEEKNLPLILSITLSEINWELFFDKLYVENDATYLQSLIL